MDNKLSIHFGKDTTKLTLFASTRKIKKAPKLNITNKNIQMKQHSNVTYVGSILDAKYVRESMFLKLFNKIMTRLKFLHRKKNFSCNTTQIIMSLIHPHFDYASPTWSCNLIKKIKSKIEITPNK